jgi:hypothetical protein
MAYFRDHDTKRVITASGGEIARRRRRLAAHPP